MIQYLRLKSALEAMGNRWSDTEEHRNDLKETNGTHPTRALDRKTTKQNKNERNIRDLCSNIKCANIHVVGVIEGEGRVKNVFNQENYGWKLFRPKEGNRYPGTASTESPKQDEPNQTHTNTSLKWQKLKNS